ncbi:MAG: ACP S-malonyltransferase [Bacteroidales bacterium]|nr:ACP S-malonyltransferase [Bacteroidales bacterium]
MKAFVFPGQGSQFPGMGKELYYSNQRAKSLFNRANEILGFDITKIMFSGSAEDLRATAVTQPAIFLHSVIAATCMEDFNPEMTAGHSLGEFSALVAAGAVDFEDALRLVAIRADAMQKACEAAPGTMAAVLGMDFKAIEDICEKVDGVVVPANYNSPGQLVISGEMEAVQKACEALKAAGAKRALVLPVGGAFHSPLMAPAAERLAEAIGRTAFHEPFCPVYQNVDALPTMNPDKIRENLLKQLTSPVRWAQTVENMIADGATSFTEVGPGTVLAGLIKKTAPEGAVEIVSVG